MNSNGLIDAMAQELVAGTFYHGSPLVGLRELLLDAADPMTPFGPAVYLSRNRRVAEYYAKMEGTVYSVELSGRHGRVINYDRPFIEQPLFAQQVVQQIYQEYWLGDVLWHSNARCVQDLLHGKGVSRAELNAHLRAAGIWMVYGELSEVEKSGGRDGGVQYAVLEPHAITHIRQLEPPPASGSRRSIRFAPN